MPAIAGPERLAPPPPLDTATRPPAPSSARTYTSSRPDALDTYASHRESVEIRGSLSSSGDVSSGRGTRGSGQCTGWMSRLLSRVLSRVPAPAIGREDALANGILPLVEELGRSASIGGSPPERRDRCPGRAVDDPGAIGRPLGPVIERVTREPLRRRPARSATQISLLLPPCTSTARRRPSGDSRGCA